MCPSHDWLTMPICTLEQQGISMMPRSGPSDGQMLAKVRVHSCPLYWVTPGECLNVGVVAFCFHLLCLLPKVGWKARHRWALAPGLQHLVGSLLGLPAQLAGGCASGCRGAQVASWAPGCWWVVQTCGSAPSVLQGSLPACEKGTSPNWVLWSAVLPGSSFFFSAFSSSKGSSSTLPHTLY